MFVVGVDIEFVKVKVHDIAALFIAGGVEIEFVKENVHDFECWST